SLYQAIGELRGVLKADAVPAEFIATVPRKGYRLVAPVGRPPPLVPGDMQPSSAPGGAQPSSARANGAATAERAIAVLPFRDLGLAAELSFLREALLAGLIQELSRQPDLAPIARGTMLSYLERPAAARKVGNDLQVRYVLDGTIAQVRDALQIACELVDAQADAVLASEAVEVPAAQWPELAQRVVGRLARAARLKLSVHAARAADAVAADDASARELAMRAWVELYCRPQTRETNERAWKWAAEALRRDDTMGAAWNALAYCEWRAAQYQWSDRNRERLLPDAVDHAQRATSLAPDDPDAYYTLGLATFTSGELARSEANLRHCLEISSSYAPAYGLLGLVRASRGHPEETAELCARAFALSPREPLRAIWHWAESCAASMMGRDGEALERASLGIAANPDYPSCYLIAAVSSLRAGKVDEAARYVTVLRRSSFSSLERLRQRLPEMIIEPWASAFLADLHAAGLPER
ncbi:MAG TPA: hypothetical protein PKA20_25140, partial [Burkholderiaceae bacterium]|nr:hypothetical protein [Burkholderiaceae bacterium]